MDVPSQSISGYPVSSYCYSASSATSVCVLFVHNKPNIRNITDVLTLILLVFILKYRMIKRSAAAGRS